MPFMVYVLFIFAAFLSFVFGVIWMSRKIDNLNTFGDIYVNDKELYLDASPGLFTQKDGQYVIMRVIKVENKQSREKQGL